MKLRSNILQFQLAKIGSVVLELIRYQLRKANITAKYLHLSANISNAMKMFNQYQYVFENVSENHKFF